MSSKYVIDPARIATVLTSCGRFDLLEQTVSSFLDFFDASKIVIAEDSEDAAGAVVAPDTLARARAAGLDPRAVLAAHDSYGLFSALGDLVSTGPTLTNVNDVRALLIG